MEGRVHQLFVALSLIFLIACQSEDDVKDLTVSFSTCESCFVCSGMELQKDVILTAAHCFEGKNPDSISRIRMVEPSSRSVTISRIEIHPDYSRNQAEYDVALIIIKESEVGGLAPNVLFNTESLIEGETLFSVSYGPNGKRKVKEHEFIEKEFEHLFAKDINPICKGNSGGPVYKVVDNTFLLVGVVSGIDATVSQLKGSCNKGFDSRHTDIMDVSDWMAEVLSPVPSLLALNE